MSKHSSFTSRFVCILVILLSGIVVFIIGCRKVDRMNSMSQTTAETENKFFNNYRSADARQKALVDFLKRKNDALHFVETTVGRIGYPRWDKAITFSNDNTIQSRTESEDENATITYIPFVRDSQNYVNASLLIKTTSTDTVFRYLLDWQYASYGFGTVSSGWNARDVFHVFARLNKEVFGKTAFRIKDDRLFGAAPAGEEVIVKVRTSEALLRTEGSVRVCVYDDVCYNPPDGARCEECTLDCPQYQYTEENCTIYWIEEDWNPNDGGGGGSGSGGGSPGGGGGGSGGGGGNGTPPQCNNGTQPPDPICGPAWEIYEDDVPMPPPEPVDSMLNRYSRAIKTEAIYVYDNLSQPSNVEYAFTGILNNNQIQTGYRTTNNDSIIVMPKVMIGNQILLFTWHSHVSRSTDISVRGSFSPEDIEMLRNVRCLKQDFVSFADCRNKRYALIVTDVTKASAFFSSHDYDKINSLWTTSNTVGNTQDIDERKVKNVIKGMQDNGIAFYVSNDSPDFQNWILLNP